MAYFEDDFVNTISQLAYKGIDTAAISEVLSQLSVDPDPDVRQRALDAIEKIPWASIAETPQVIYEWLLSAFLVTAAAGIAIGRRGGEESISRYDVRLATETACDEWPECMSMRVSAFAQALSSMVVPA